MHELLTLIAVAGLCLLQFYFLQDVREINCYIQEATSPPRLSDEYAYIKDFMDRNLKFYVLFTSALVAFITAAVGYVLKLRNQATIDGIRNDFSKLKKGMTVWNDQTDTRIDETIGMLAKVNAGNVIMQARGGNANGAIGLMSNDLRLRSLMVAPDFKHSEQLAEIVLAHFRSTTHAMKFLNKEMQDDTIKGLNIVLADLKDNLTMEHMDILIRIRNNAKDESKL